MPKRVYISHHAGDDVQARLALEQALLAAGHEIAQIDADLEAAIVVVGSSALDSIAVVNDARGLLERQPAKSFPVVPLLLDGVSPQQLRSSSLRVLAENQMSTAATLTGRITETVAAIEVPAAPRVPRPAANLPHPFSPITAIEAPAKAAVIAVAFGEIAGEPAIVAGFDNSTVQIWSLRDQPVLVQELHVEGEPVRSVAIGQIDDRDIILCSTWMGPVWVWAATSGELLLELPVTAVRSVAVSPNGPLAAIGTGDGEIQIWQLRTALSEPETAKPQMPITLPHRPQGTDGLSNSVIGIRFLAGIRVLAALTSHGDVWACRLETGAQVTPLSSPEQGIRSVAALGSTVFGGDSAGGVTGWDATTGKVTHRFSVHSGPIRTLAAGYVDGAATVVCGDDDGLLHVWDVATDVGKTLVGHTGAIDSVAVSHLHGRSVIISGSADGTIRVWGDPTYDHVEWLSDTPADHDLLGRRPLARAVAGRLRRTNDQEPGTSLVVHIDGPWGAGKSTLMRFLQHELAPAFTPVHVNAWRAAGMGPAWWALLTSLRTAVGQQRNRPGRTWLRIRETLARVRRAGAPFVLALSGLLLAAGVIWELVDPGFGTTEDTVRSAGWILVMIGMVGAGALVASRFLLWNSARGAKALERHHTGPMLEVARHFGWLMARSKNPVVFFVDDLDRCPDKYVVELLDNVQTLLRDTNERNAHVVVAADRAWIRASYEQAYEKFGPAVSVPGQPLGHLFLDKFFQLRVPVPAVGVPRGRQYLNALSKGAVAGTQDSAVESGLVRERLSQSTTEAQIVETLQGASIEVRDQVAGTAVDRLSTPAVMIATEHSLQRYAHLLPPIPRTMKRFVNAYSVTRVVRTLEGNPVDIESLALWTIIEIRWPSLADHLRARPESIGLVGKEDLAGVPEELRVLFGDPALGLIAQAEFDADVIRSCCGLPIPVTDR
ncbi:MAG: P-loop NTPase fold protein [Kibdelosporangium sp.]